MTFTTQEEKDKAIADKTAEFEASLAELNSAEIVPAESAPASTDAPAA